MIKYQGEYQVCQEYFKDAKGKYQFTDNPDATYIVLKNGGQVYRYDDETLVLHLVYSTPISSLQTEIKSPLKGVLAALDSKLKLVDTYLFDDGIKVYFKEKDLLKVMQILGNKHGTYSSRVKRYYKSRMNLPDFKFREKERKTIKNKKQNKKLLKLIKEKSKELGKNEQSIWKILHGRLRKQLNLPSSVGAMAQIENVSTINIIDSQNWYKECFDIIEKI